MSLGDVGLAAVPQWAVAQCHLSLTPQCSWSHGWLLAPGQRCPGGPLRHQRHHDTAMSREAPAWPWAELPQP